MRIENEYNENSIIKSSIIEDLNDNKRYSETSFMKNEKENDFFINLKSFEYIMNQMKRTKWFNAYKNRIINAFNHFNAKIEYYDILYLRKYEFFMSN